MYFFPPVSFSFRRQQQLSQLNLNAMLLAPGLFDYPQTGSCAGFHSFHHALNQCELAPLSYFMRGDFSASPLCRWFWLPLPSQVFKRWILVTTRELTLLPSLSPACLPDCLARLDILGHMLMRITLGEREDAECIYRCLQNEAQWQEYYTRAGNLIDPLHSHMDESGFIFCHWAIYALYMQ